MTPQEINTEFVNRFHEDDREAVQDFLDEQLEEKWTSMVKGAHVLATLKNGVALKEDEWQIEDYETRDGEWRSFHESFFRYNVCFEPVYDEYYWDVKADVPDRVDEDGWIRGAPFQYWESFDGEPSDQSVYLFVEILNLCNSGKELEAEDFDVVFKDGTSTQDMENLAAILLNKLIERDEERLLKVLADEENLHPTENLVERDSELGVVLYGKMKEIERLNEDLMKVGIDDLTDECLDAQDVTIREALRADWLVKADAEKIDEVFETAESAWVQKDKFQYWISFIERLLTLDAFREDSALRHFVWMQLVALKAGRMIDGEVKKHIRDLAYARV